MLEATPYQVDEYLTPEGRGPFSEWLGALKDLKGRALIRIRLDRLSLGNLGDCNRIGESLHERVQSLKVGKDFGFRPGFGASSG